MTDDRELATIAALFSRASRCLSLGDTTIELAPDIKSFGDAFEALAHVGPWDEPHRYAPIKTKPEHPATKRIRKAQLAARKAERRGRK